MSEGKSDKPFNVEKPNVPGVKLPPHVGSAPIATDVGKFESLPEDALINRLSVEAQQEHLRSRRAVVGPSRDTIGTLNVINIGGEKLGEEGAVVKLAKYMNALSSADIEVGDTKHETLSKEINVTSPGVAGPKIEEYKVKAGDVIDTVRIVVKSLAQSGLNENQIVDRLTEARDSLGISGPFDKENVTRQIKSVVDISKPPKKDI